MNAQEWQDYLHNYLMFNVAGVGLASAAVISHDRAVLAQSANFPMFKVQEIDKIKQAFAEPGKLARRGGLRLGGTKYNVTQEDGNVIKGIEDNGRTGIVVRKTNTTLVVGIHDRRLTLEYCNEVVENAADILNLQGL